MAFLTAGSYLNPPEPTFLSGPYKFISGFIIRTDKKSRVWQVKVVRPRPRWTLLILKFCTAPIAGQTAGSQEHAPQCCLGLRGFQNTIAKARPHNGCAQGIPSSTLLHKKPILLSDDQELTPLLRITQSDVAVRYCLFSEGGGQE